MIRITTQFTDVVDAMRTGNFAEDKQAKVRKIYRLLNTANEASRYSVLLKIPKLISFELKLLSHAFVFDNFAKGNTSFRAQ